MLLTPRTYTLAQVPDANRTEASSSYFLLTPSQKELRKEEQRARRMLLLHQTGAVKVGEVIRQVYPPPRPPPGLTMLQVYSHIHAIRR